MMDMQAISRIPTFLACIAISFQNLKAVVCPVGAIIAISSALPIGVLISSICCTEAAT